MLQIILINIKSGNNLIVAIPPLIVATIIAIIIVYILEKRIPYIPLFGGLLISFFGGLTIYFQNPIFIYLKPTIINIVFAFTLLIGKVFFKKNFLKIFFKGSLKLGEIGWDKLMYRWIGFFIVLAILNEIIWRTQSQEAWVNFKVWGILSLTFVFTAFQIPLINKYKNE